MGQRPGPDDEGEIDEWVEHLTGDGHCPLCGGVLTHENIRLARGSRLTLSVQCYCCGAGSLITAPAPRILRPIQGPVPVDPTLADLLHFAHLAPLAAADVLEMRAFLVDFQGDLADFIRAARGQS